ncbi:MAG: amidohydrolase family protein [Stellaceae bacterium]
MDYRFISCDDHLDLNNLPADVWTARLPAKFKDRAPHIERRDGRAVWVCDGKMWGGWSGRFEGEIPVRPKMPFLNALDRGGIKDQSERRPGVAELRLAEMDRDGVEAHVMFGPVTAIEHSDPELRDACYSAYNDWLAEFCAVAPDRLIGVPQVPEFPDSAVKELERLIAKGCFRQVLFQVALAQPRIHDKAWEPFWNLLEQSGMQLSWHVTAFLGPGALGQGTTAGIFVATKSLIGQYLEPFVDLFAWGVLEHHPKLKIMLVEGGLGWLPWVVQDLDYRHWRLWEAKEFWADKGGIDLVTKPSEIFKRQIWATFQEDNVAMDLLKYYGDDKVLWASDYPHPDSIWPNSHATVERQMKHLSPETRRKLTRDNAAKLYGLDQYAARQAAE